MHILIKYAKYVLIDAHETADLTLASDSQILQMTIVNNEVYGDANS